jgi:chromosome partitioning protein
MAESVSVALAIANSKGGCGKSTTVLILAGEYVAQGYTVHIIDADPSERVYKWVVYEENRPSITASRANGKTMRAEIEKARQKADVILIDVEGSANAALTMAIGYSNAVLIPATMSPPDVEDAMATYKLVQDMADAGRGHIPCGLVWSAVPPAIRSREMTNLEAQVAEADIPVIGRVMQRTAFSSLFSFMKPLDELPPTEVSGIEKAKADAIRLTDGVALLLNPEAANEAAA